MSNIETASQTGLHFGVFSLSPSDQTALRIYRRRLYFRMTPRKLGIPQFFIDTNCVNARCGNEAINILEKWDIDGVISIRMPWDAQLEAKRGNNYQRWEKALSHIAPLPLPETSEERNTLTTITKTIFGKKVLSDQDRRDVLIVFTAKKYCAVLV